MTDDYNDGCEIQSRKEKAIKDHEECISVDNVVSKSTVDVKLQSADVTVFE